MPLGSDQQSADGTMTDARNRITPRSWTLSPVVPLLTDIVQTLLRQCKIASHCLRQDDTTEAGWLVAPSFPSQCRRSRHHYYTLSPMIPLLKLSLGRLTSPRLSETLTPIAPLLKGNLVKYVPDIFTAQRQDDAMEAGWLMVPFFPIQ